MPFWRSSHYEDLLADLLNVNCLLDLKYLSMVFSVRPKVGMMSPMDSQVETGANVGLMCTLIQGDLPVTFHWAKDGVRIENIDGIKLDTHEGISSLAISRVNQGHAGNYTCLASNPVGFHAVSAEVLVNGNHASIILEVTARRRRNLICF